MAEEQGMEEKLTRAMRERAIYFKEQADSLTLEGVRRVLEKDLRLKKFELDVHKRFIKQCLDKCFQGCNEEIVTKLPVEIEKKDVNGGNEEPVKGNEELQRKKEETENKPEDEQEKNGSISLPENEETAHQKDMTPSAKSEKVVSEDSVKNALMKRASYLKEHAETMTLMKVRRLLEADLELEKHALDCYKSFISMTLDEVLQSSDAEVGKESRKKSLKKVSNGSDKKSKGNSLEESDEHVGSSDSKNSTENGSEDEDHDEEMEMKAKGKKNSMKGKVGKIEMLKKRRRIEEANKTMSQKKKKKPLESDHEQSDESEEDSDTKLSVEDSVKKKKEVPTPFYGKCVEHLKSVIKACGVNVPPSVYKRVKQAPESKREGILIKELEDILGREGLSANPSEKEIKSVRKNKERAKELEGIDMSNIVSSTRRRSSSNFILPPPKPNAVVESDDDDDEEGDDDEDSGGEESSEDSKEDGGDESD